MARPGRVAVGPWRLHGTVAGEGRTPAVVLVHGLGASRRYMLPLARELAATCEVHAIDLPGFGRSPAPPRPVALRELADAVRGWLDVMELERPVLVANSLGCQHVVELAARGRPTAGLVLVGPTVDADARTWPRQIARFLVDVPREPTFRLAAAVLPAYVRAGPRRLLRLFGQALRDRIEDRVGAVAGPVTVVRGERDPVATAGWCARLARAATHGRLVTIDGAAHAAHFSHPALVAATVRAAAA